MGCGTSKSVKVDHGQTRTKPQGNGVQKKTAEEGSTEQNVSKECIDEENGEAVECHPPIQMAERSSPDGGTEEETSATENITCQGIQEIQEPYTKTQPTPSRVVEAYGYSETIEKSSAPTKSSRLEFQGIDSSIFSIIRSGVYVDDLTELVRLKTRIWELDDEIRVAILKGGKPPPPISEKEGELENPRRVRPPRNFLREKANVISLEHDFVFDIFVTGRYDRNVDLHEKLIQRERELKEELSQVKFPD